MTQIQHTDLKAKILESLDIQAFYQTEVAKFGKPNSKGQAIGVCPFHADENPSCSFDVQTGYFNCFGCGEKGSVFDFYMKKYRVDFSAALSDLRKIAGTNDQPKRRRRKRKAVQQFFDPVDIGSVSHPELGKPDDVYTYTCGQVARHYLYVCRFTMGYGQEKTFRQCRPDGKGGVLWLTKDIELVPYNLSELSKSQYCFISEGEKDVETLRRVNLVASCNPMGAGNWRDELNKYFEGKKIAILPDNDEPGRKHALRVARSLHGVASSIKIVELPGLPDKGDISDWLNTGHTKDELLALVRQTIEWEPKSQVEDVNQDEPESAKLIKENTADVRSINIQDFLALELPPRKNLLSPWLPNQGLAMLHAKRGVGKTYIALGIACAIASGGDFLRWKAPEARGVLFIDGEMPAVVLQERISNIVLGMDKEIVAPLRIITPDLQKNGVPNLSSLEGQIAINKHIDDEIYLIIVDNISTLVRSGRENTAEDWQPVQDWALSLRARGKSVLLIHHDNKLGGQRGTAKKEDVLDSVICLRHPPGYVPEDGAAFQVHYEKARGIFGKDVEPFEARLSVTDREGTMWAMRTLTESTSDKVIELSQEGLTQKEISETLSIHKSNVSRHVKKAQENGKLP